MFTQTYSAVAIVAEMTNVCRVKR